MTVKISAKQELGISKLFEVKETNKKWRKSMVFYRKMVKSEIDSSHEKSEAKPENEGNDENIATTLDSIDASLQMQTDIIDYIVEMLNLKEAYAEKLDDLEFESTQEFAARIAAAILHVETQKATDVDKGLEDSKSNTNS